MIAATAISDKHSVKNRFKRLKVSDPYSLVASARKGIKSRVFYDFAATIKIPEKTLAGIINISARTISNYKEQQKPLDPVQGEHLLKLIALYEKGENIFGNIDEFNYWLKKPFWNTKEIPLDWAVTPGGIDLLMKELDRLAEGYPV